MIICMSKIQCTYHLKIEICVVKRIKMFKKGHTSWKKGFSGKSKWKNADRGNCFAKGHKLGEKGQKSSGSSDSVERNFYKCETSDEFSLLAKSSSDGLSIVTPDCDGTSGSTCLLRPRQSSLQNKERVRHGKSENIIVNESKMLEMFATSFKIHCQQANSCQEPDMDVFTREKLGLCWKYSLYCKKCNFVSPTFNLYKEAEQECRGPNPGATNVAMAIAIQDSPLGGDRFGDMLRTMGIQPPTKKITQRLLNKVGVAVKSLNEQDMKSKINMIKDINRKRGNPENEINISTDGRYNSYSLVSRNKPGHGANQGFSLAIENNTDRKYIIACAIQNKLCWSGAWLKGKGVDVDCPGGHAECTANLDRAAPFSEFCMGKDIGTQLALQDVLVRYVTTDGDSQSAKGLSEGIKALYPLWEVNRLADTVHLGQAQFRASYRAKYSSDMFHGSTKEENRELQRQFSIDLKTRSSLVTKKLFAKYNGDIESIGKDLPKVLDATLRCYAGNCSRCSAHSLVCKGGLTENWWTFSRNLSTYNITTLNMCDSDKFLVQEVLKMKLSVQALQTFKLMTDTNKNESMHHAANVTLPKSNDFGRNMEGRLHSLIHRSNNLPGTSAMQKCQHMGIDVEESTKLTLGKMDKKCTYHKEYARRSEVQARNQKDIGQKVYEHRQYKCTNKIRTDYKKGQLDPTIPAAKDHAYYKK